MPTITYQDFDTQEARNANYLIDLYEGNQVKYIELALSGSWKGGQGARPNWRKRGYVPRTYNVVKEIVEKSAMLFNKAPKYEILPASDPNAEPVVDSTFNEILSVADWQEFSINLDNYTRLLGATCVLVQRFIAGEVLTEGGIYRFSSDRGDTLVPLMLHRGNSVVVMNSTRTQILELGYITMGCVDDEVWEYRVITPLEIVDYQVVPAKPEAQRVTELSRVTNPAGRVTANMWYDTSKPRQGVWPRISEDLISGQEMLNTHLTDMQFATSRNLGQTLVLQDVQVLNEADQTPNVVQETNYEGNKVAWYGGDDDAGLDLGIGSIVSLKTSTKQGASADVKYVGPSVNLLEQAEVVKQQLETLASGWAVSLKTAGDAGATSGFQLVVEELDNLQLRERRAKSFQAGFRRFYENVTALYPELTEGQLQVIFAEASLPVNKAEDLKLWTDRLNAGLATPEDFFMATEGLSREEAVKRAKEVAEGSARADQVPMLMTLLAKGVITTQDVVAELKRRGVLGPSVGAASTTVTPEGV